jgi:hypothetical protein
MFIKQIDPEAAAFDGFQELLGNDEIRIDICAIQGHDHTRKVFKFSHKASTM